jgi:hypothetical protein
MFCNLVEIAQQVTKVGPSLAKLDIYDRGRKCFSAQGRKSNKNAGLQASSGGELPDLFDFGRGEIDFDHLAAKLMKRLRRAADRAI